MSRGGGVQRQAGRGGDRRRPGAGADGDQEGPHRRQDQASAVQGGVGEPKLVIIFETEAGPDGQGVSAAIDGTLRGPDALIELVAFHLHRLGAAKPRW